MHNNHYGESAPINPVRICLSILVVAFISEFLVMLVLPLALTGSSITWNEAVFDAALLTLVLIPFLWLTVIRPLQDVARMRAQLLEQFVMLQEEERRRIAFDLHDEIGQSLTSVLLGLRMLEQAGNELPERINDLRTLVTGAVQEVRRIANGLRPATLDHLGLAAAIERLAEDFGEANGLEVEIAIDLPAEQKLPISIETAVYRIAQEALTNIVRHAEADRLQISLTAGQSWLTLAIMDNGIGMWDRRNPARSDQHHFGLVGMKERTALLDGTFTINSRPGGGTQIQVRLPLPKNSR